MDGARRRDWDETLAPVLKPLGRRRPAYFHNDKIILFNGHFADGLDRDGDVIQFSVPVDLRVI